MLERYSERARRVLFFARQELSVRGGEEIKPAHLLLGIARDSRVVEGLLAHWKIPVGELQEGLKEHVAGGRMLPGSVEVPFSPPTKRVLNGAAEEADRLLHYQIEPEHLLLALLREDDPAGVGLRRSGMTLDAVREHVAVHMTSGTRAVDGVSHNTAAIACRERIMQYVHELAEAGPDTPEASALVTMIDIETMELMRLRE